MTITLTAEHERIIQAQLATGQFRSVEDLLDQVLAPLQSSSGSGANPEAQMKAQAPAARIRELRQGITLDQPEGMTLREYAHLDDDVPKNGLLQFFRESPLVGLELEFDRDNDTGRDITL